MADTTVDKLERMKAELDGHKKRLDERVKALRTAAKNEPDQTKRELMALVAESLDELVETGLDFQSDLTGVVLETLKELAVGDDGELDDVGGEVDVGLEPEDADRILKTLSTYKEMIVAYEEQVQAQPGVAPAEVAELKRRREECVATIELVEGLVLEDGEGAADEDEDDDEEEAATDKDGAPPPTN